MPRWDDRAPVGAIDPDAFLYLGANPCWTPGREYKTPDAPDALGGLCSECGGDPVPLVDAAGDPVLDLAGEPVPAPVAVPDGSRRVCGRCMRYGRGDGSRAAPGCEPNADPAVPVSCPDDPGYVERDGVKVPERFARKMKG